MQENIGFFKTKLFDIQHKLQNECRGTFTAVFFEAKIPFSDVPSQSAILISKLQTLYMKTAGTIESVDTPLPVLLQEKNQSTRDEFDFSNLERALRKKKSDDGGSVPLRNKPQLLDIDGQLPQLLAPSDVRLDVRSRSEERRVGKESRSRWSPYH